MKEKQGFLTLRLVITERAPFDLDIEVIEGLELGTVLLRGTDARVWRTAGISSEARRTSRPFLEELYKPIPLPARRPFREAKLRIDAGSDRKDADIPLLELLADAFEARRLVMASPHLSLNQLAKRERRCRTQLARLLRISWLSPRIVDAIAGGAQPRSLSRRSLLATEIPVDWTEQERLFGLAA